MQRFNFYRSITICAGVCLVFSALYGLQRMPSTSSLKKFTIPSSIFKSFKTQQFSLKAPQSAVACPAQTPKNYSRSFSTFATTVKNLLPSLASFKRTFGMQTPPAKQTVSSSFVNTGFNNYVNSKVYFLTSWLNESSANKLAQDPSFALVLVEQKWSPDALNFYTAVLNLISDKAVYEKMIRSFMATVVASNALRSDAAQNKDAFIQVWLTFVNHTGINPGTGREGLLYEKNIMTPEFAQFLLKNTMPEGAHDYTDLRLAKMKASIPSNFQIENLQKEYNTLD